jgi:hypothetical protein
MGMYGFFSPWTTIISASRPLTLDAYMTFLLVPFIAASLIGEDMNTNVEGGWERMQLEGDQGDDENPMVDDDPALEAVFAANAKRRNLASADGDEKKGEKKQLGRDVKGNKENKKPSVSPYVMIDLHAYPTKLF